MWKTNRGLAARGLAALIALGAFVAPAQAEPEHGPEHGIAMYGTPALPQDFVSLPYANPDAPKGGVFISGETGSFDSLNPHIRKGRVPWQLRFLAHESLMGRSYDEPFTLYGLLAESVETDPERTWVEFTLREEARFSERSSSLSRHLGQGRQGRDHRCAQNPVYLQCGGPRVGADHGPAPDPEKGAMGGD